jgi:hypothetical protein
MNRICRLLLIVAAFCQTALAQDQSINQLQRTFDYEAAMRRYAQVMK